MKVLSLNLEINEEVDTSNNVFNLIINLIHEANDAFCGVSSITFDGENFPLDGNLKSELAKRLEGNRNV